MNFTQRVLGAVDLAIDFATLGEYGLQTWPEETGCLADGSCRERRGRKTAWEALPATRPRGRVRRPRDCDRLRLFDAA